MPALSFVTLLAYDYRYAFLAVRSYYDIADEIILGVDRDRVTHSGNPFHIDMREVADFVGGIDRAGKIRIVEDDFHSQPTPMDNDTHERNVLSLACRPGNWVVQIDADETLVDPAAFGEWMPTAPQDAQIKARWISVFKVFGDTALVIDPAKETAPVATLRRGEYTLARCTVDRPVLSPLLLLHYAWGRTREELKFKLHNWSHSKDFDVDAYFRLWDSVTMENYRQFKDFHPIVRGAWMELAPCSITRAETTPAA